MFSDIMTLTELNKARASVYSTSSKDEWPMINAAYSKRARELRAIGSASKSINVVSLRPRISIMTGTDTITDAFYNADLDVLCIVKYVPNIIKITEPVMERVVEIDIQSTPLSIGVRL